MEEQKEKTLMLQPEKKPLVLQTDEEKARIQTRLRRIEGQVRGLQKMVEADRYCVDILIQISAVQAALKKVGFTLLERHTKSCVTESLRTGENEEKVIDELMEIIRHYAK